MPFTEVDPVDLVTLHEVRKLNLHFQTFPVKGRSIRDGEDILLEDGHQAGGVVKRERKGLIADQVKEGSGDHLHVNE